MHSSSQEHHRPEKPEKPETPDSTGDIDERVQDECLIKTIPESEIGPGRPRLLTAGSSCSPLMSGAGSMRSSELFGPPPRSRFTSRVTVRTATMGRATSQVTHGRLVRSHSLHPLDAGVAKANVMARWTRRHFGPQAVSYVLQLWPPLLGMACTGYAFMVPVWLMVMHLVVGLSLLHLRLMESWFGFLRNCNWLYQVLVAGAVLVGVVSTIYQAAFQDDGNVVVDRALFVVFGLGGMLSTWIRTSFITVGASSLGRLPGHVLLTLLGAVATVSPDSSAAQLPYMILFLAFLAFYWWRCRPPEIGNISRHLMLIMTTTHVATMLALSVKGSHSSTDLIHFFGAVGRTLVDCANTDNKGSVCATDIDRRTTVWTVMHIICLLLLHMALANYDFQESIPSAKSKGHPASTRLEPGSHIRTFFALVIAGLRCMALMLLALQFPSFLTLPCLILAFMELLLPNPAGKALVMEVGAEAVPMDMDLETSFRDSRAMSDFSSPTVIQESSPHSRRPITPSRARMDTAETRERSEGLSSTTSTSHYGKVKTRPVKEVVGNSIFFLYLALVLVVLFVYDILSGELVKSTNPLDSLQLDSKALSDLLRSQSWENVLGLRARPLSAFAGWLTFLVTLEVMTESLPGVRFTKPTLRTLGFVAEVFLECYSIFVTIFTMSVAMMVVLMILLSKVMCQDGDTSLFTLGSFGLLALLLVSRHSEEPRWLWLVLLIHAQISMVLGFLLYVVNEVNKDVIPQVFHKDLTSCTGDLEDMARPLGIALCACFQSHVLFRTVHDAAVKEVSTEIRRLRFTTVILNDGAPGALGMRTLGREVHHSPRKSAPFLWTGQTVRRLRRLRDAVLVSLTLVLALSATMAPPADMPSLGILLVIALAMLAYNLEEHREMALKRILRVLQVKATFMLILRCVVTSPLFDLPNDDGWFFTLEELGLGRPMRNPPMKEALLGLTAMCARLTIASLATADSAGKAAEAQQPAEADEASSNSSAADGQKVVDGSPVPTAGERGSALSASGVTLSLRIPSRQVRESNGSVIRFQEPGHGDHGEEERRPVNSARSASVDPSAVQRHYSLQSRSSMNPMRARDPWEVALLKLYAPRWLTTQAHAYLSVLLLIAGFTFSIFDATVLNALVILAVISLCSWSTQWVQAGNVFSITTVLVMLLQYVARFKGVEDYMKDLNPNAIQNAGMEWSADKVVRHCGLLAICFAQKQLWYRSRHVEPRRLHCPSWIARHADIVGMFALLVVAVARRHIWSPFLVLAMLPWFLGKAPPRMAQRSRLRKARMVLFGSLVLQVVARLSTALEEGQLDQRILRWWCDQTWGSDLLGQRQDCVREWRRWLQASTDDITSLWLFDFFALLGLGLVQLLLQASPPVEPVRRKLPRRTMVAMHWWPCVVWCVVFLISLEGGSLLGLVHLCVLMGLSFNTDKPLDIRMTWARRTRLCATFFLFLGLCEQSPLVPCSRASCRLGVHRIFMPRSSCSDLESINVFHLDLESMEDTCNTTETAVLGHDTIGTLMTQVVGFRRLDGNTLSSGLAALFSQLGLLVLAVLATTVQIRIYNSQHYRKSIEENFLEADRAVRLERARRYVHEFHCRCSWQVQAQRVRKRVLRTKLKRTIRTINDILNVPGTKAGSSHKINAQEVLQLHMGIGEQEAQAVTSDIMFGDALNVARQYLRLLHQVALGRQREEDALRVGDLLHRRMQASASTSTAGLDALQMSRSAATAEDFAHRPKLPALPTGTSQEQSVGKRRGFFDRARDEVKEWWKVFKKSPWLSNLMQDYIFLGIDEFSFTVRDPLTVRTEDLYAHRQDSHLFRLLGKIIVSHSQVFITLFTILAFIQNRSVLDMVRIFLVFFLAIWVHPFPPHRVWKFLQYYSAFVLLARSIYNLPFFCGGLEVRTYQDNEDQSPWDPKHTFSFCEVTRIVTADVVFGVAKKSGPSALEEASWFWAVWADHLCLVFLLVHEWALTRSGIWDFVRFDRRSQRVWLNQPEEGTTSDLVDDEGEDTEEIFGETRTRTRSASAFPSPELSASDLLEGDFKTLHRKLVEHSKRLHRRFIRDYQKGARVMQTTERLNHGWIDTWRRHLMSLRRESIIESEGNDELSECGFAREASGTIEEEEDEEAEVLRGSQSTAAGPTHTLRQQGSGGAPMAGQTRQASEQRQQPARLRGKKALRSLQAALPGVLVGLAARAMGRDHHGEISKDKPQRSGASAVDIGDEEPDEAEEKRRTAAALIIQLRFRQWQHRHAWQRELRCDCGHQLKRHQPNQMGGNASQDELRSGEELLPPLPHQASLPRSGTGSLHRPQYRRGMSNNNLEERHMLMGTFTPEENSGLTCDMCCLTIEYDDPRWSCKECDYHLCETCVFEVRQRGAGMGMVTSATTQGTEKSGVSFYLLKYIVAFILLVYALLAGAGIVNESGSFSDSVVNDRFSLTTLMFTSVHLAVLITDRIFHKLYYRRQTVRSRSSRLTWIIDYASLGIHFLEVIALHIGIIWSLSGTDVQTSRVRVNMWKEVDLCVYYIGWMAYLSICMVQEKYGRPVIDLDMLRPMEIETLPMVYGGNVGVWLEQIQAVCFLAHYYTPFVDDLRIIIDWSVMPTSLDLWMYYKVEDAHTSLFRVRHHMFVRRSYFFAERRTSLEKMYSGWCLLFGLLMVILMPMIIFSPIAPFRVNVSIIKAPLTMTTTFAQPCSPSGTCRTTQITSYQAEPRMYQELRRSIQEGATQFDETQLIWPLYSQEPVEISPYVRAEIAQMLDLAANGTAPLQVVFEYEVDMEREDSSQSNFRLEYSRRLCFCSPLPECRSMTWPAGPASACDIFAAEDQPESSMMDIKEYWQSEQPQEGQPGQLLELRDIWASRLRVEASQILLRQDTISDDLEVGMSGTCATCTTTWGSLRQKSSHHSALSGNDGVAIIFELEKLTRYPILSGDYGTVIGLYVAVVLVIARYVREAFMDSSKRAIYEEIPNVGVFLDLAVAVRIARDHRDLRTEFQLYYCLMKVLRSTNLLLTYGGHEVSGYGFARKDACPAECVEPVYLRRNADTVTSNPATKSILGGTQSQRLRTGETRWLARGSSMGGSSMGMGGPWRGGTTFNFTPSPRDRHQPTNSGSDDDVRTGAGDEAVHAMML